MNNDVLFSSDSNLWSTPQDLFDKLDKIFNFTLDVCALSTNAKCSNYYTPNNDGLKQKWEGTCWMNPPYGREISIWISKAYKSAKENNTTVVCLVPARVDTHWWHDYCINGEIYFIKGRLKFSNHTNSAPFPSAIIIFRGKDMVQITKYGLQDLV